MMASTVADNVSRTPAPLSANPSRNQPCLRAGLSNVYDACSAPIKPISILGNSSLVLRNTGNPTMIVINKSINALRKLHQIRLHNVFTMRLYQVERRVYDLTCDQNKFLTLIITLDKIVS